MDTKVTLTPKMNIVPSPRFCDLDIDNPRMTNSGMRNITTSNVMFKAAFVIHTVSWFMHLPPGIDLSHEKAIGVQMSTLEETAQAPYATTRPNTTIQAIRKQRTGKMRKYWTRMETLIVVRVRL